MAGQLVLKEAMPIVAAGVMGLFQHGVMEVVKFTGNIVTAVFKSAWDFCKRLFGSSEKPNMFIIGDPSVNKDEIVFRHQLCTNRREHIVDFRMRNENEVITAIAVLPLSEDLPSPEVEITEGGINWRNVKLRLTAPNAGKWECDIKICGS